MLIYDGMEEGCGEEETLRISLEARRTTSGSAVTEGWEPPDMGAVNRIWVLQKRTNQS